MLLDIEIRNLLGDESFQNIELIDIVEAGQRDAALEAVLHFAGIVLETLQSADLAGVNHFALANHANLGGARNPAIGNVATGDRADLGDAEDLANLGPALVDFLEHRRQQTGHGALHLVHHVVNDGMNANVDLLALGGSLRIAVRLYVEANDDCL